MSEYAAIPQPSGHYRIRRLFGYAAEISSVTFENAAAAAAALRQLEQHQVQWATLGPWRFDLKSHDEQFYVLRSSSEDLDAVSYVGPLDYRNAHALREALLAGGTTWESQEVQDHLPHPSPEVKETIGEVTLRMTETRGVYSLSLKWASDGDQPAAVAYLLKGLRSWDRSEMLERFEEVAARLEANTLDLADFYYKELGQAVAPAQLPDDQAFPELKRTKDAAGAPVSADEMRRFLARERDDEPEQAVLSEGSPEKKPFEVFTATDGSTRIRADNGRIQGETGPLDPAKARALVEDFNRSPESVFRGLRHRGFHRVHLHPDRIQVLQLGERHFVAEADFGRWRWRTAPYPDAAGAENARRAVLRSTSDRIGPELEKAGFERHLNPRRLGVRGMGPYRIVYRLSNDNQAQWPQAFETKEAAEAQLAELRAAAGPGKSSPISQLRTWLPVGHTPPLAPRQARSAGPRPPQRSEPRAARRPRPTAKIDLWLPPAGSMAVRLWPAQAPTERRPDLEVLPHATAPDQWIARQLVQGKTLDTPFETEPAARQALLRWRHELGPWRVHLVLADEWMASGPLPLRTGMEIARQLLQAQPGTAVEVRTPFERFDLRRIDRATAIEQEVRFQLRHGAGPDAPLVVTPVVSHLARAIGRPVRSRSRLARLPHTVGDAVRQGLREAAKSTILLHWDRMPGPAELRTVGYVTSELHPRFPMGSETASIFAHLPPLDGGRLRQEHGVFLETLEQPVDWARSESFRNLPSAGRELVKVFAEAQARLPEVTALAFRLGRSEGAHRAAIESRLRELMPSPEQLHLTTALASQPEALRRYLEPWAATHFRPETPTVALGAEAEVPSVGVSL